MHRLQARQITPYCNWYTLTAIAFTNISISRGPIWTFATHLAKLWQFFWADKPPPCALRPSAAAAARREHPSSAPSPGRRLTAGHHGRPLQRHSMQGGRDPDSPFSRDTPNPVSEPGDTLLSPSILRGQQSHTSKPPVFSAVGFTTRGMTSAPPCLDDSAPRCMYSLDIITVIRSTWFILILLEHYFVHLVPSRQNVFYIIFFKLWRISDMTWGGGGSLTIKD